MLTSTNTKAASARRLETGKHRSIGQNHEQPAALNVFNRLAYRGVGQPTMVEMIRATALCCILWRR